MTEPARDAHLPALTGLRGIAAGLVVGFHLWLACGRPRWSLAGYPLESWLACGYLGVDLFFVLSGFLLALPFVDAAQGRRPFPSWRTFFARRARRVVPAYWAHVAVLAVVAFVLDRHVYGLGTLAAHVVFLQILVPGVETISLVTWTLPVEWTFYLVLPLIGLVLLRARWPFVLALALAWAVTMRLLVHGWWWDGASGWVATPMSILHFNARVDQFVIGVIVAWYQRRAPVPASARRIALALGIAGWIVLMPFIAGRGDIFGNADYPWLLGHFTLTATLWALVVFGLAGPATGSPARTPRVLLWLGTVSFSLYLWHLPVIGWTWRSGVAQSLGTGAAAAIAIAGALAVAWLSYRFVERPFLHAPRAPVAA